jgi:hypothetical protein
MMVIITSKTAVPDIVWGAEAPPFAVAVAAWDVVKPGVLVEVGVVKNDRLVLTGGPVELSNEKEQPCIF